ncbi:MAG: lipid-A-disaccharide synthase-related protein [Leptolyngbya sp.]|nr:lipid-A-disaccharide synthase-related protein [Leptolyngbya sp.]
MNLLCISNGHGEDIIAVRVLKELRQLPNAPSIAALPLVGEGGSYQKAGIPIVGPTQTMPSGGFIYMDARQVIRDVQGGVVALTWEQIKTVRAWGKAGGQVLAVGDVVPLLMAWASGAEYAFIGTAKSEYYVRNEAGRLPNRPWWEGRGSIYLPWERWLMRQRRCRGVFVRDQITADHLQRCQVKASYPGNPMMDGLDADTDKLARLTAAFPSAEVVLTLALMPGSRAPEAFENWQRLLVALDSIAQIFSDRQVRILGAIAPSLNLAVLKEALIDAQWQPETGSMVTFCRHNCRLVITTDAFAECLHLADAVLATAGTATEQAVGLGKPVFAVPGAGPQFTAAFAEAQARLLGPSVMVVADPTTLGKALAECLHDQERLQGIADNGRARMGQAGAGRAIATSLIHSFGLELPVAAGEAL